MLHANFLVKLPLFASCLHIVCIYGVVSKVGEVRFWLFTVQCRLSQWKRVFNYTERPKHGPSFANAVRWLHRRSPSLFSKKKKLNYIHGLRLPAGNIGGHHVKRHEAPLFSRLQGNGSWRSVQIRDDDDELRVAEKLPLLSLLSLLTATPQRKNRDRI